MFLVFCSFSSSVASWEIMTLLRVRTEEDRHRGTGCSRRWCSRRRSRFSRGYCYVRGLRVGAGEVEIKDDGEDEHEGDCCRQCGPDMTCSRPAGMGWRRLVRCWWNLLQYGEIFWRRCCCAPIWWRWGWTWSGPLGSGENGAFYCAGLMSMRLVPAERRSCSWTSSTGVSKIGIVKISTALRALFVSRRRRHCPSSS